MSFSFRDVKNYYDKKGRSYDNYSKQFWSKIYDTVTWHLTKPYVPTNPNAVVFDAAGGTGKWSIPIAQCGPKVVLGDISRGMLEVAKEKVNREDLQQRIEVKECDLQNLDFGDQTFDLVFCDHALCFIKEQNSVIKELTRVLKKGCPLIVSGQNRYLLSLSTVKDDVDLASKVLVNETQFVMRDSLNVYPLSPEEFEHLLDANGVAVEKLVGKLFTMPLALSPKQMVSDKFSGAFFDDILKIELELSSRPDAVALGGHFQALGYRQ